MKGVVNGEPVELMRAPVPMEDAQASFSILCLPAASSLSHLLCTVPPFTTHPAATEYDALVEWALASIIAGGGAFAAGLPIPEQVGHDPTVCQNQTYLEHETLRQGLLPIPEGGLGLISSNSIKRAAYTGCHVMVLGRNVADSARENFPSLLKRLPGQPMTSTFLKEGKIVTIRVKRGQIEDAVGGSCASLAVEEDSEGRRMGTPLVETEAAGGGGGGEMGGRKGGC